MKKLLLPFAFFISVLTSTLLATSLLKLGAYISERVDDHSAFLPKENGYTIKIISAEGGTYGYEIYSKNKLVIRQLNIPGQSGNKGFKKKSDAQKVARLVADKMSKGIMPPTVEKAEMEKLGVEL